MRCWPFSSSWRQAKPAPPRVAVAGNPLDDIALTSKVSFVMQDGVVYVGSSAQ